ncbi:MAG: PDZ domain-containing protein [Phycisphaerae bacterium]|nr:PDZ domain-containing protein [Phycisphaerae bacterium]
MPGTPALRRPSEHVPSMSIVTALTIAAFLGATSVAGSQVPRRAPEGEAKADELRKDMRRMIEVARDQVFPALVNIHVVTIDYWAGKEHKGRSVGSGTIISEEGYVITNQHVTNKGQKFTCTLSDKQEISAKLVGEDPLTDLAVLKLDLSELKDPGVPLPVARFGDSSEVEIGDHVMAMGSPFALSRSVTLGIVSNTERVFTGGSGGDVDEMELESGQRTGMFTRWIQHDALIHRGNSGGPLVNLKGEVIGVNELGGTGMGFAIPSNLAETVTAALIEGGEVVRSWIGVSFKPIKKTGLDKGVLIDSVVKEGPADKAGIEAGDVVLKIDGEAVTVLFPEQVPPLMKRIADLPLGSQIKVSYDRDGSVAETTIVTEKLQKDRGDETALRAWGVTVEQITEKMARDLKLDSTAGVLVSSIRSGGPAQLAEPPLGHGDVIRVIDGQPIDDLAAIVQRYEAIMDTEPLPEYLLVEFDRGGENNVTLLKPKPDEDEDPPREVHKAWIGVATQPVLTKLASKLGHPDQLGYRVTRVYPRTLATDADLRVGDIILALNGSKLRPRGMQDAGLFARRVRKLDIDDEATLTTLRNGETKEVTVKLEASRRTPAEARREKNRDFELTVREVTFFDRDDHRWDESVKGVLVEQVESAGWAGLGGISQGDLIQRIDRHPIRGLESYRKAMKAVTEAQPERVVFVVLRGVQTRFQYVEPDWSPIIKDVKTGDEESRQE